MNPSSLYLSTTLRRVETRHATEPLMQRAGAAAAEWVATLAGDQNHPVLVLAGPGNNGGDAFEVARLLQKRFFDVCVVFAAPPDKLPADAASARQRYVAAGGVTTHAIPEETRWSLIVDGLFGIGLTRAPEGDYAQWITAANRLAERDHCPLLALDCPSGLNADTGIAQAPSIHATHTITFIAAKPGLFTADGPDHCGEIRVASLDLDPVSEIPPDGQRLSLADVDSRLKPRRNNTHKGSFGSAGILGGAKSMVGAAFLAGRAALKMGAGRVYLGMLDPEAPSVDLLQPELMMRRADALLQADLQALACGPGLGRSAEALRLLEQSLKAPVQLVLDADALNLLAEDSRLEGKLYNRVGPAILTPHPAEAARLLGCSVRDIQSDRIKAARELAERYRSHIALKGCGTLIATVDGRWWINTTGNPGMATAGMGDVLSGLIVALLAQNWPPEMALLAAVHLHGAAADRLVAHGRGPIGLTAGEIIDTSRDIFNEWVAVPPACKMFASNAA
uniref:Bifunctional NAD(P)H-hydrate repair enzyme n=1 Tax=Dechloromonas aromatica (strain RCB) TaxID=159087 RepID=Q47DG6_DECAR